MLAYEIKEAGGKFKAANSRGELIETPSLGLILTWIATRPAQINVVYDSLEFMRPILKKLPKEKAAQLVDGKAIYWDDYRLWYGITRHGRIIGITYYEPLNGNIVNKWEREIYELKQYSTLDNPGLLDTLKLGRQLILTLSNMGIKTDQLKSAAAIYKENVLDKMAIPTMLNMPDESLDAHELALNNIQEWIADYKSIAEDQERIYSYDLTAAYPWALAGLPNLYYVREYEKASEIPPGCYYGVMYGKVHNKTLISPLVHPETGRPKVGYWQGTMNTWEYGCCYQWGIAEFDIEYGYFIHLGKYHKLFEYSMLKLYEQRNGPGELQNNLAKAMAVSVIGKFQEMRGKDYGELFNPLYADMVTSAVRVKVADFIYKNRLQSDIASVTIDGLKAFKDLKLGNTKKFGEWRQV